MRRLNPFVLPLLFVVAAACSKPGAESSQKTNESSKAASLTKGEGAAAKEEKPAAKEGGGAKARKLDKVGLSVDLPEDATVSDGLSDKSVMISTGAATLTVSVAKDTDPKTSEDAKGAALATENMKIEKLSDGWIVTSENTGSAGRNFWLTMRREVAGKGYLCESMQSNDAQVKAAIAICKGLKG
ncbi:MAG: hypothetical protein ACHREM_05505 [Polyangiales bacterium]